MSAPVARLATTADHPLMVGSVEHCHAVEVGDGALGDRLRLARRFLEIHPDLDAWMARPLPGRLTDLQYIRAWPLISSAILSRRVTVDLDVLVGQGPRRVRRDRGAAVAGRRPGRVPGGGTAWLDTGVGQRGAARVPRCGRRLAQPHHDRADRC